MNLSTLAHVAYSEASAPVKTERSTEYQVFSKVTHRLSCASTKDFNGFINLAEAVNQNRKLWAILAADVAGEENKLPKELRAQIFYLAEFTELHSRKVLARNATQSALVEINKSIMRGLRSAEGVNN